MVLPDVRYRVARYLVHRARHETQTDLAASTSCSRIHAWARLALKRGFHASRSHIGGISNGGSRSLMSAGRSSLAPSRRWIMVTSEVSRNRKGAVAKLSVDATILRSYPTRARCSSASEVCSGSEILN